MQRPLVVEIASGLLMIFAWSYTASRIFELPPLAGAAVVLLFGGFYAARYVLPGNDPQQIERRARSRARGLGPQWPWAIVSAIAVALFLLGLVSILSVAVPPEQATDAVVSDFLRKPLAIVPLLIADGIVDPLVQEVTFRGWIQGRLSQEYGPEAAIVSTAGLFAAVFALLHLSAWNIPPLFLLGLASGYTVYLTRSVWAGVLMNAAFGLALDLADPPTLSDSRLEALAMRPDGLRNIILVMAGAAVVAILAWHRQRIIRDRLAAAAGADAAHPTAD